MLLSLPDVLPPDDLSRARAILLVGRPVLHGPANGGAQGLAHVLRLLRDGLEIAMALCGCRLLDDAGGVLHRSRGS